MKKDREPMFVDTVLAFVLLFGVLALLAFGLALATLEVVNP